MLSIWRPVEQLGRSSIMDHRRNNVHVSSSATRLRMSQGLPCSLFACSLLNTPLKGWWRRVGMGEGVGEGGPIIPSQPAHKLMNYPPTKEMSNATNRYIWRLLHRRSHIINTLCVNRTMSVDLIPRQRTLEEKEYAASMCRKYDWEKGLLFLSPTLMFRSHVSKSLCLRPNRFYVQGYW